MGHSVGDAADAAVKRSKPKEEKKVRTEEQIIKDIENNLNSHLAIPPDDVRLLLNKYKQVVASTGAGKLVFTEEKQ